MQQRNPTSSIQHRFHTSRQTYLPSTTPLPLTKHPLNLANPPPPTLKPKPMPSYATLYIFTTCGHHIRALPFPHSSPPSPSSSQPHTPIHPFHTRLIHTPCLPCTREAAHQDVARRQRLARLERDAATVRIREGKWRVALACVVEGEMVELVAGRRRGGGAG